MLSAAKPSQSLAERVFGAGERGLPKAVAQTVLIGALVFGLANLALTLTRFSGGPPAMWSANAVVLACLVRTSRRRWPTIMLAAGLGQAAAMLTHGSPALAAWATAVDMVEALLCASVLRYLCGRRVDLSQPRTLMVFGVMVVVAPLVSGGILASLFARSLEGGARSLGVWFCAHALGFLIVTPVILALRPRNLKRLVARPMDLALLAGFTVAVTLLLGQTLAPPQLAVISLILLITFRMEQTGAAIAALITAAVAMGLMLSGVSGYAAHGQGLARALLEKQISLAIMTSCALAIGANLAHRRRLRTALKVSLQAAVAARTEAMDAMDRARMAEQVGGVGFWRLELANNQVSWSPEMFRIWNLEGQGAPDLEAGLSVVHPDDREIADGNIARAKSEIAPFHTRPVRLLLPDGSVRHLAGRMGSERNAAGQVVAIRGALIDITHLRLADEAVRASEERYRLLAEHSSDIIIRVDLQDTILYVSPSCRSLGYEPEELIGSQRWRLTHPDDLPRLTQVRDNLTRGVVSSRADREYRMLAKDGGWVWVEGSPSLIRNEAGEPIELVSQLRDITERKAFEAELVAARDAAEAAAKAKSEFLANMSHEIRTPLTSIMGFSSLLGDTPALPDLAVRYVQRISTAGQSLLSVVNDILDFSKLEAGQVDLDPHAFDPAAYVEDTVELLTRQAENKGLTLGLIIDDSVPERIEADSSRLRQVLLNLIGNAIKFTAEGRVSVSMTYAGGLMRVAVADTGPGIAAEQRERLFQRFSQVDGAGSRQHGGTGLGLAISKSLVALMGGDIGVDSEDGRGSVFWFTIAAPAVGGATPQSVGAGASAEERAACRILVVDDVAVNRELVRAMLEPFGHTFAEAENGAEAVAAALREPFDLILMDLQMPGMDGISATKAIRATSDVNALTPILALSANVLPDHLAACAAAGMDDHIGKPIQPVRLLTKVAQWGGERHEPGAEDKKRA